MRVGDIVRNVVMLSAVLAAATPSQAQTTGPAVNISAVVRGGVVIVSYDLISTNPTTDFSIVLEASSDGGKTYNVRPRTLKGDVGPAVRAGMGKQITWEAAQDVENLEIDRYRFRVVAQPVRAQTPTMRASQPPQQPPALARAGGGNGSRWGGFALLGAGGVLAVLGTTALKEEECASPCAEFVNKKLVWTGVAAAAGGIALLASGGRNDSVGTHIVIRPRGIMVQHRLRFKGIAPTDKR